MTLGKARFIRSFTRIRTAGFAVNTLSRDALSSGEAVKEVGEEVDLMEYCTMHRLGTGTSSSMVWLSPIWSSPTTCGGLGSVLIPSASVEMNWVAQSSRVTLVLAIFPGNILVSLWSTRVRYSLELCLSCPDLVMNWIDPDPLPNCWV